MTTLHKGTDLDHTQELINNFSLDAVPETPVVTRSGRQIKLMQRMIESQQLWQQQLVLYSVPWEVFHDGGYQEQEELEDPIAFVALLNPDILYHDEAMKVEDSDKFREAMAAEVESHKEWDHWELVDNDKVPEGTPIFWQSGLFITRDGLPHKKSTNGRQD